MIICKKKEQVRNVITVYAILSLLFLFYFLLFMKESVKKEKV